MIYGMLEKEFESFLSLFPKYPEVESVVLYGSRAKGTNKPFSDIDITLKGPNITRKILNDIAWDFEELYLPYFLDVSIYNKLKSKDFVNSIDNTGVTIYHKNANV